MPKKIVVVPVGTTTIGMLVKYYLLDNSFDSSRFPQPARHEPCPCCVRPIAARLSSFWQLLYQNLFFNAKEGTAGAIPSLFMLPLVRLFFSDPRGMNCIHPSRDQSLKGSPIVKSFCTLTALAFRNPHGMSFAHATCDLLLLGCRASRFT